MQSFLNNRAVRRNFVLISFLARHPGPLLQGQGSRRPEPGRGEENGARTDVIEKHKEPDQNHEENPWIYSACNM